VHFDRQILPGTFEYTLNYLIDEKIDLARFEARDRNNEGGVPAYAPAMLATPQRDLDAATTLQRTWQANERIQRMRREGRRSVPVPDLTTGRTSL
jgi:hypothetical protein